jgi:thioredoxin 1
VITEARVEGVHTVLRAFEEDASFSDAGRRTGDKEMSQYVSEVSDGAFERDVLGSELPVVLDFWAEWCPPCRALAPTFEELAKQYEGRVRFLKLNVDENAQVPQRFGIKGIPTLVFFDGGREVERIVGASSKEALARIVDKYVKVAA